MSSNMRNNRKYIDLWFLGLINLRNFWASGINIPVMILNQPFLSSWIFSFVSFPLPHVPAFILLCGPLFLFPPHPSPPNSLFCLYFCRCLFLSACVPGWLIALEMRNRGTNFAHRSVPWRSLLPTASLNQVRSSSLQVTPSKERSGACVFSEQLRPSAHSPAYQAFACGIVYRSLRLLGQTSSWLHTTATSSFYPVWTILWPWDFKLVHEDLSEEDF